MAIRVIHPKTDLKKKGGKGEVGRKCAGCGRVIEINQAGGTINLAGKNGKLQKKHCHLECMSRVLEIARREKQNWYGKKFGPAGQERNKEKKLETVDEYMRRMAKNRNRKITFTKHD